MDVVADPLEKRGLARGELLCLQRRTWHWLGVSWRRAYKRDLDAVDEMLAPDFVNRNKLLPGQNPIAKDYLRGIARSMPPNPRANCHRGSGSRGRQGGHPLRRARPPR